MINVKMTEEKFKPAGREKIDTKKWKCINEHSGDGQEMVMCFGKNKMLSFFDDGRIRFSKEKGNVKVDGRSYDSSVELA